MMSLLGKLSRKFWRAKKAGLIDTAGPCQLHQEHHTHAGGRKHRTQSQMEGGERGVESERGRGGRGREGGDCSCFALSTKIHLLIAKWGHFHMERTVWGFQPTSRVEVRGQGVSWGQGSCRVHTGCPSTTKWRYFCYGAHFNRLCCSHQTRNAAISCDQRAPDRKPNKEQRKESRKFSG